MAESNRQVRLAARPSGAPADGDFELVEAPMPTPVEGEMLVRAIYLSLDPYMRGRMSDAPSYAPPVAIGEVMVGAAVGEVMASEAAGFAAGDIVEGRLGWQTHALARPRDVRKVDPALAPISTALGVLGMPGLTAYFGLLDVGRPEAGQTVVVSAASGAVGAIVGQIARIKGCRAVGIAGSDEKVAYLGADLGFDAGINYRTWDVDAALGEAAPEGVDVYFDNVGGPVTDAVFNHINRRARIVVCGQISQYNLTEPDLGPRNLRVLIVHRARIEGFLVFDYLERYDEGLAALAGWIADGRLHYREDITDGLENAPAAFRGMLEGANFGKQLVRVGAEPAGLAARG
jgi:NADPH-dependent curcumin reductase CurA